MPESDASNSQEPAASGGFERIFNPYVIGNPIRGGEPFFGREDDFAFVARRLESERSGIVLLFAGARRSGKTSINYHDPRPGDVRRLCADSTRATTLLGYKPEVDLGEGLRLLKAWYESSDMAPAEHLASEVVENWVVS